MLTGINRQVPVGQTVRLERLESGSYRLTFASPGQPGQQVTEVGTDYLVIDDPDTGVATRIPAYLIQLTEAAPEAAPQAA
jgi:hypothetical protein